MLTDMFNPAKYINLTDLVNALGSDLNNSVIVKNWFKKNNWDAENPTPIPADVIETTRAKYIEAFERITGNKF